MKYLKEILLGLEYELLSGSLDCSVSSLTVDSRQVVQGSVFVAMKGEHVDGHVYVQNAVDAGAKVIVAEDIVCVSGEASIIKVKRSNDAVAILAKNFYDNPSSKLKLVGIAGTNGKTSIATWLYDLFNILGLKSGLISTISVKSCMGKVVDSKHTTPFPIDLNRIIAEMVGDGCEYCFMEVSSHACAQGRIAGLHFKGAVFTNITHDHLDYHKTFAEYLKAKKSFFDSLSTDAFALTNVDDKNGMVMLQNCEANKYSYSLLKMADFKASIVEKYADSTLIKIMNEELFVRVIGDYNIYNILAVFAVAKLLGGEASEILQALTLLKPVAGRMEFVSASDGRIGVVDYAHTPDALKNVLETLQRQKGESHVKIITVVGCGGDRDKTKRPLMAKVAQQYSDKVILTSDNPRTEDPSRILEDMFAGIDVSQSDKVFRIENRADAIKVAASLANAKDIILVAGKGHESYQEVHGKRTHFDDKEQLLNVFK
ncbi:MAG: UDP-N-acetylmuramoyl-L-alanyl-D-glutamate--2,6-diaminopimelate ligase [Bacteroidales bacterium]